MPDHRVADAVKRAREKLRGYHNYHNPDMTSPYLYTMPKTGEQAMLSGEEHITMLYDPSDFVGPAVPDGSGPVIRLSASDNPGGYIVRDVDAIPHKRHYAIVWSYGIRIPADHSNQDSRLWVDAYVIHASDYELFEKEADWKSAIERAYNGPKKFRALMVEPVALSINLKVPPTFRSRE